MALTNAELRTLLKANIHKDSTFSDPDDLNTFLTLGQERIVRDSPTTLGTKEGTLSLTTGGRVYDLASDFYQMKGVFYPTNSLWLEPVAMSLWLEQVEAQASIASGEPYLYVIWGFDATNAVQQIKFNYTPSASMTYYYWYYWFPIAITGSATSPISSLGFSELLLEAATMSALKRNDPDGYAVALTNYQRLLREYREYRPEAPDQDIVLAPSTRRVTSRLGPYYPVGS
jgi:hypothetical protein